MELKLVSGHNVIKGNKQVTKRIIFRRNDSIKLMIEKL